MNRYLGVEIGGTKQQIALFTENGEMETIISEKIPLPNGAPDILAWLEQHITALRAEAEFQAIGVGFGGPLDSASGRVAMSVQVKGWKDFCLKTWFEEHFSLPATVVNDTVAGGYGELLQGSGRGCGHFYYTNIGTGIGGAMFIHGHPYDGTGLGAAYMGHTYIPSWTVSEPMNAEKLENLCCGVAMERRLRTPGYVPSDSALYQMCKGRLQDITCAMLGEAAAASDPFALAEVDRWARSYSIALSNFITLLAPERVAVGGGVANMGEILLTPVRTYVDQLVFVSSKGRYDIVRCELMDHAVLVGAALFARDGFHPA